MADVYVVMYNPTDLNVIGMWLRATSDNIDTATTDEQLSVDEVKVVVGVPSDCAFSFVKLTDPTVIKTDVGLGQVVVDDGVTPTDTAAGDGDLVYLALMDAGTGLEA